MIGPIVKTTAGQVRGFVKDGVRQWRGIPYASAPRFAPPAPPVPWAGERDATRFGPVAIQARDPRTAMISGVTDKIPMSEDCLAVNIFAPDRDDGRAPVLVWIHGGAFVMGSGSTPLYDGTSFARKHGIVVVTLNYRLGVHGFHKGNHALLDQIAALAWVRDNIAAFGGDPARVTVMGESAGAIAIATLLAMPAATGLFQRAILQSGASPLAVAVGEELPPIADDITDAEVVALQQQLMATKGLTGFAPYVDGRDLPGLPIEHTRTDVPLLLGYCRDEWKLFELFIGDGSIKPVLAALANKVGQATTDRLLAAYGGDRGALVGELAFRMPMLRLAARTRSHVYRFDWRSPAMDGKLGASHGMDLPFTWNKLDLPASKFLTGGASAQPLADRMHDAWAAFVHTGEPGWPLHGTARTTKLFDTEDGLVDDPDPETRRAWGDLIS